MTAEDRATYTLLKCCKRLAVPERSLSLIVLCPVNPEHWQASPEGLVIPPSSPIYGLGGWKEKPKLFTCWSKLLPFSSPPFFFLSLLQGLGVISVGTVFCVWSAAELRVQQSYGYSRATGTAEPAHCSALPARRAEARASDTSLLLWQSSCCPHSKGFQACQGKISLKQPRNRQPGERSLLLLLGNSASPGWPQLCLESGQ